MHTRPLRAAPCGREEPPRMPQRLRGGGGGLEVDYEGLRDVGILHLGDHHHRDGHVDDKDRQEPGEAGAKEGAREDEPRALRRQRAALRRRERAGALGNLRGLGPKLDVEPLPLVLEEQPDREEPSLLRRDPLGPLPVLPQPLPDLAGLAGVPAHAVELPSPEGAGELAAVGPGEGTVAVLRAVLELPHVDAAVRHPGRALPVLEACPPQARVGAAVAPATDALAVLHAILPLALVGVPLAPGAEALPVADAIEEVADVALAVGQSLAARSGLLPVDEHTYVLRAVLQGELALPVDGAGKKLALVHAAVGMVEDAVTLSLVADEGADVSAAVGVEQLPLALPHESGLRGDPLPPVLRTVGQHLNVLVHGVPRKRSTTCRRDGRRYSTLCGTMISHHQVARGA
mmetsp:Transcript_10375/g.30838  ORF Transcript_10375/g.30838 Transcript_10375/m.30838 type:complete len:402 (-) Transcript_10375:52-1257(-)